MEKSIPDYMSKVLKSLDVTFYHKSTTKFESTYVAGGNSGLAATFDPVEGRVHIYGKANHSLEFSVQLDVWSASIGCKAYSPQYFPFMKSVKLGLDEEGFFQQSLIKDLTWTTFEEYNVLNKLRAFFDDEARNRL